MITTGDYLIRQGHSTVFLISLYGRTIGPKSFLFGTAQFSVWASGAINYDYVVTNSITSC